MSRKLSVKFIQKSFWAISCVILLSAAMLAMSGCGKQILAKKNERQSDNSRTVSGKVVKELVGKWQKKPADGSYEDYGVYAENLGSFESLEITEDARVHRASFTAAKNYDCRTEDAATSDGTIIVESGSELNITLDVGTLQHTDGCSAEKNYTSSIKATTTNYQWKLGKDKAGRAELCLTQTNGETACYRREE
jgi:hypothetical protein